MKNINNLHHLKEKRKTLRKNLTPAEATLWLQLKNKQRLGMRFRRQFSVGNYILDFYCPSIKLAIELDGKHHIDSVNVRDNDFKRTQFLDTQGIEVIRFENELVFKNIMMLLETIDEEISKRLVK